MFTIYVALKLVTALCNSKEIRKNYQKLLNATPEFVIKPDFRSHCKSSINA